MVKRASLKWLKRFFSSKSQISLPAQVYELLQHGAPVQVQKIPGQGRGLIATRDIEYGEMLFREQPYLCAPASSRRKQVCYHCLKVLPQRQQDPSTAAVHSRSGAFCSHACLTAAQGSYFMLESQVNLTQLESYCDVRGERFPLLAARLALMVAQQALMQPSDELAAALSSTGPDDGIARFSSSSSSTHAGPSSALNSTSWTSSSSRPSHSRHGSVIGRLSARTSLETSPSGGVTQPTDHLAALSFLCFANVPPPPPAPWAESHHLLLTALEAACDCREDPEEGQALAAAVATLDIDWYVSVLARLHLNTFRVDAVLPLDWNNLHAAAAAMLQPDSGSTGSALYLLASLFNHSCEPSVNVNFPGNDGTAVFTAARRISAGEQLFISYTDVDQDVDVRQQYLAFSYGFQCLCPRCRDDIAELRKGTTLNV